MSDWLEAAFNQQRPQAIAALTRFFRDIDTAEDAFAEACLKALTAWKDDGAPRDPLAWLLATARNAGLDSLRKSQRRAALLSRYSQDLETMPSELPDPDEMRDDVLRLLFICCHPDVERRDQIAIALRIVAGLSVEEIARGFLIKPKTMEQRITRAKKKIASKPVAFETPSPQERGARLPEDTGSWTIFFTVEDVDMSVATAQAKGAAVLQAPMDMPGVGRMATLTDPQGARFSLITYESITSSGTARKETPDAKSASDRPWRNRALCLDEHSHGDCRGSATRQNRHPIATWPG